MTKSRLLTLTCWANPKTPLLAWTSARLFSRSPIVHFDAPASVRAAFTIDELEEVVRTAGLEHARVTRAMPERMLLEWTPPEPRS